MWRRHHPLVHLLMANLEQQPQHRSRTFPQRRGEQWDNRNGSTRPDRHEWLKYSSANLGRGRESAAWPVLVRHGWHWHSLTDLTCDTGSHDCCFPSGKTSGRGDHDHFCSIRSDLKTQLGFSRNMIFSSPENRTRLDYSSKIKSEFLHIVRDGGNSRVQLLLRSRLPLRWTFSLVHPEFCLKNYIILTFLVASLRISPSTWSKVGGAFLTKKKLRR